MTSQALTYKTVGSLDIQLELFLPAEPANNIPILVWFHGGGLLQGSRLTIPDHFLQSVAKYNHAFISVDYRLAPQATLTEILEDVKDALRFTRDELPKHIKSKVTVDTSRIAVSGSSAGGHLALLAGLYSDVKLKVIIPLYPITDPLGSFFTNPQPYPHGHIEKKSIEPFLDPKGEVVANCDNNGPRGKFYFWMMEEANLAQLLGVKPGDDTYRVAIQIRKRESYLPTYLSHGDADRFVGVEQADEVAQALKDVGADFEYERPKGLDHKFDWEANAKLDGLYAFLYKHL